MTTETKTQPTQEWANEISQKVKSKLLALRINSEIDSIFVGATTTTVKLRPDDSVRMSKFRNIEDDLSIAAGAKCRVLAPIANTNFVGVEIPTINRTIVRYEQVKTIQKPNNTIQKSNDCLFVSLGIKPDGEVLNFDLSKMPHLLVAGASGQGKSVALNVMIANLIQNNTNGTLNLYLIDPKKVEFSDYEPLKKTGIVKSIDTEIKSAKNTLASICREMDRRYSKMQALGVKNIVGYNAKSAEKLPYTVCVIDEFSDLLMSGDGKNKEVESNIIRIAQLGRAAGVHLVIATQRPDMEVITGLIKANFPSRIAFRTSTSIDSKIIIDRGGAQQLIGNGDMLMMVNGDMIRAQCAYLSSEEIENIVSMKLKECGVSESGNRKSGVDYSSKVLMRAMAAAKTTTQDMLMKLSHSDDYSVRYAVASNATSSVAILARLATDENDMVRTAANRTLKGVKLSGN